MDSEHAEGIPFAAGERISRTIYYAMGRNRYIGYLISLTFMKNKQ